MSTQAYYKDGDRYKLIRNGAVVHATHELAIAFSLSDGHAVLHKHGDSIMVRAWYETTRQRYLDADYPDLAAELGLIVATDWDVVELNKIIDCSGYLGLFLQKLNSTS